jgi:hypothetical protein
MFGETIAIGEEIPCRFHAEDRGAEHDVRTIE